MIEFNIVPNLGRGPLLKIIHQQAHCHCIENIVFVDSCNLHEDWGSDYSFDWKTATLKACWLWRTAFSLGKGNGNCPSGVSITCWPFSAVSTAQAFCTLFLNKLSSTIIFWRRRWYSRKHRSLHNLKPVLSKENHKEDGLFLLENHTFKLVAKASCLCHYEAQI